MKKEFADYLLDKVKNDYNKIAHDFASKRSYLPDDLVALKKYTKSGDKVLDLGCGNGRLSELFPNKEYEYVGADVSSGLLDDARERYPDREFILVPSTSLPFTNNSFDVVYCLAVFHHLPGEEYRQKFLAEIRRILKPGGSLVLTVWNLHAKPEIKKILEEREKQAITTEEETEKGDFFYPFKDSAGNVQVERYLHSFTLTELEDNFKKAKFKVIETGLYKRNKDENLLIVGQK